LDYGVLAFRRQFCPNSQALFPALLPDDIEARAVASLKETMA